MKIEKYSTVLVATMFIVAGLYAQPEISGYESDVADSVYLQAVEVLGFKPAQAATTRSRLTAREIMSHDAGAILSRIPAISGIRKGGGYGYDPVLRGFKYSQVGILIDGIQTTTVACPNRMDPPTSQVSVNTLSAVEVHKGPYSLRYGNHIGGVINFLTAGSQQIPDDGIYSRISTGYESNGSILRTEAMAGMKGEKLDYQLAGSWHKGSDYKDGDGNLIPASFTRANLAFNGAFRPGERQEFRFGVTRNFARDADYPALPMDLRSDDTWLIHASHDAQLGSGKKVKLQTSGYASLVDHLMDNYGRVIDPRMVDAETPVKTRNFGIRSELVLRDGPVRLLTGADLNYENADGYRTREFLMGPNAGITMTDNVWQNGHIMKGGIFAEYNRSGGALKYHLSGRINLNSSDANSADDEFIQLYEQTASLQVNPGITGGVEYKSGQFSYALWAGRVQRSGSLSERFMNSFPVGLDPYELIGNPGLDPEVNHQADLIIAFNGAKNTRLELNMFYSYLRQFISSVIRPDLTPKMPSAPGVRQYENIESASIAGFEFSLQQKLPKNMILRLDAAAQLGTNLVSNAPLPEIPPLDLRAVLEGSYFKDRLRPLIQARYVMEQSRISSEFGETATPSFWLIDLDASYDLFHWMSVSAGVRNIFNMAYYEHLNRSISGGGSPIYNPGRNIYFGLTASF